MSQSIRLDLGAPPVLEPCPFCGHALTVTWRRKNPKARCATEDCWGAKLPVVMLDVPEQVVAWNIRRPTDQQAARRSRFTASTLFELDDDRYDPPS